MRAACTAGRHDILKRSRLKILVRRGRCGARAPGALRRRAAGCTARRQQPTRRRSAPTQTCPDPRTRLHKCGARCACRRRQSRRQSRQSRRQSRQSRQTTNGCITPDGGGWPPTQTTLPGSQPSVRRPPQEGCQMRSLEPTATSLARSADGVRGCRVEVGVGGDFLPCASAVRSARAERQRLAEACVWQCE